MAAKNINDDPSKKAEVCLQKTTLPLKHAYAEKAQKYFNTLNANSKSNSMAEIPISPIVDLDQKQPVEQNTKPADTGASSRFSAKQAEKYFLDLNKKSNTNTQAKLLGDPVKKMKAPARSSVIMNAAPVNAT